MTASDGGLKEVRKGPGCSTLGHVATSRIGESLKAARARLGWSREALAFHSGVSWSAIAQIECGRRQDVRLSSLSALADALRVSVDYLIGSTATISRHMLEHRVLPYGSDEAFLARAVPYLAEGVEQRSRVLAVTTPAQIALLREGLGDHADHVEFADSAEWYSSPNAALDSYRTFVHDNVDAGASWIHILGEPVWVGRSDAERTAWTRYESLLNLAFAFAPATIVCPYDTRLTPLGVVDDAYKTHPESSDATETTPSPHYRDPERFLLDA